MSSQPKYPQVHVQLVGEDGNAVAIIARVRRAMRNANIPQEEISQFTEEATSGDYNHLLQTVMGWVSVDLEDEEDEGYWNEIDFDEEDDEDTLY